MLAYFQKDIDDVKTYVSQKIGCFKSPIYTRDSFFGNSAFTDLIHNLQLQITDSDISLTAPLAFNSTIKAGDVTMADMFKLYRFENLLFTLRMTGEEIRKHLEYSYDMWTNTMISPDDHALRLNEDSKEDQQRTGFQYYTFNFDSACGIDYEVDLTKPDGQKVKILRMSNGEPFDEKKWYKVAMNSYRANGGGELLTQGAGIPKDSLESRVIFHTDRDQRHFLTEEIRKMGTLDPKPNNNWKFVPEAWVKPALERDRQLLFDGGYTIPFQEEPPTEVKPWTHQMDITPMADGSPVVTYRIDNPITDSDRFEMIGLRQSYYKLPRPLYLKAGKCQELLYWDQNTKYCGVCGAPMRMDTDISKKCTQCGKEIWPQLATAVIVLIHKGDEVLLVRAKNFRRDFFGLVAGFVETGETLEEAVAREALEETGVTITNIRYFASQPWPYPCGLMVGFNADYVSGEIHLQKSEIAKGGWFRRDNLPEIPEKLSIARMLLDDWLKA